ncbi:MAG TPA: APC family permease, partial [Candidatus Limnocylindria bacterium]
MRDRSPRGAARAESGGAHLTLRGSKPGDRRVHVRPATSRYFRYTGPGVIAARLAADEPRTTGERWLSGIRRVLFGRPLSSEEELAERLPIWKALPVFSSDVMSSVAYATEASLYTLLAAGTATFWLIMPISGVIVAVLALVTISYRQTIRAYPNGGGSYIVAHANLGELPGLVAAAALLVDYVLTVAVSVSAGVFALTSLFPSLNGIDIQLIVFFILLVMVINLRGLRESGTAFASPTYVFLVLTLSLIAIGVVRTLIGDAPVVSGVVPATGIAPESLGLLLVMRAFADGCSAMTGTEAVTNGVPAFKPPEWKNARTTMAIMSILLATMFIGTSFLARVAGAMPSNSESVLSQIGRSVFGPGPAWWLLQLSTTGILILAAQTSFADFPRLSSILAKDGYFPRQFAFRGERLAFNAGIIVLAALSIVLVVAFQGRTERLIPLYAVGVFTAFTLSQAGMVRHWFLERTPGWRRSAVLNGVGAVTTLIVVVIFAIAKFALGAWIVIVIVPALVGAMLFVKREYREESRGLAVRPD